MIIEPATVVAVEPEQLWVSVIQKSTCGSCQAKKGCGHGLINEINPASKQLTLAVKITENHTAYNVGDTVDIAIHDYALLRAVFFIYMLPLLFMLAIAMLASVAGAPNGIVAGGALFGLVGSFFVLNKSKSLENMGSQPWVVPNSQKISVKSIPSS